MLTRVGAPACHIGILLCTVIFFYQPHSLLAYSYYSVSQLVFCLSSWWVFFEHFLSLCVENVLGSRVDNKGEQNIREYLGYLFTVFYAIILRLVDCILWEFIDALWPARQVTCVERVLGGRGGFRWEDFGFYANR